MIPKSLWKRLDIKGDADLYRVILCEKCHYAVTTKWLEVDKKIGMMLSVQEHRPLDKKDESVENTLGDNINQYYLLLGRHALVHQPTKCPVCKKPRKRDWIQKKVEAGADEGHRNITRFLISLNMKRLGMKDQLILDKLLEFNNNCRPPEPERDVKVHMKSIARRWRYYGL